MLLVVHGMGQHDAASVEKTVVDAFTTAFGFYESLKTKQPADLFRIVPVAYDDIFEAYRQRLAQQTGSVAERISKLEGSLAVDATKAITDVELSIGNDQFFNTHWLDVLLYRFTLLSEPVRLRVAAAVAAAVKKGGAANVHVLGHSLGTAVVHDALAKSYGPENIVTPEGEVLNLDPTTHRLGGVHMMANVSRALQTFVKVGASIVRPGPLGCTSILLEYRHRLDPITKVRQFNPTDNGGWIPHGIFNSVYGLIEPTSVTAANVHDLGHYLTIPQVHLPLFKLLFKFRPKKAERDAGEAAYFATTVEGKARALQTAFGDLNPTDADSVQALLAAAKALKDMVTGFGESF